MFFKQPAKKVVGNESDVTEVATPKSGCLAGSNILQYWCSSI